MKKNRYIIIILVLIFLIATVSGELVFFSDGSEYNKTMTEKDILKKFEDSSDQDPILIFFDRMCTSCREIISWLNTYEARHPDIKIIYYDLYKNVSNREMFENYMKRYNQSDLNAPTAFIGPAGLEGNKTIEMMFEPFSLLYTQKENS